MTEDRRVLRIGTRGSTLATTQAGHVRDALIAAGHPAELVIVKTAGDESMAPVERIGVGVFTAALREVLLGGGVDIAVHSFKDLPTAPDPRFVIAATPPREDPRDALVSRDGMSLSELPAGARVGTSAPRRVSQLRALGLGLDIRPLRGNIERRIGFVDSGELDAVILARAGLARAGYLDRVGETIGPERMIPAPAQGALAVECRAGDTEIIAICAALDCPDTRAAITAERSLLAELEAGCTAPVGALARIVDEDGPDGPVRRVRLEAAVAALDGSRVMRGEAAGDPGEADAIGRGLARDLIARGAAELVEREVDQLARERAAAKRERTEG